MSTENQEPVTVEAAEEEKTETKEVKGTKRAAEVSISTIFFVFLRSTEFFVGIKRKIID